MDDDYIIKLYKNLDSVYKNIRINDEIEDKLKEYQKFHVFNMINSIKSNRIVFDSSHTGTGKTYTTVALWKQLKLKPIIICEKSNIWKWIEVLKYFDCEYSFVINYNAIRNGKFYNDNDSNDNDSNDDNNNDKLIDCKYIEKDNNKFKWKVDPKTVFVFDEVHRCKNYKSINGKLLLSTIKHKVIMLSATMCDKTSDFGIFGLMLGLYKRIGLGKRWVESLIRKTKNKISNKKNSKSQNILHSYLIPKYGNQMIMDDISDDNLNQINVKSYDLSKTDIYDINKFYKELENNIMVNEEIVKINKVREKIENVKTKIFTKLISEYLELNKSIVIFVNYKSSFKLIHEYLDNNEIEHSIVEGSQTIEQRKDNIKDFQSNNLRVILMMIQAGGQSISLHDESGKFPRVSLISPSYSSIELVQALGRIYRSGVKTVCEQNIIYCNNTKENEIVKILRKKKNFMNELNDSDLSFKTKKISDYFDKSLIE
jgi:SNF2 family DNA or RNA helicase